MFIAKPSCKLIIAFCQLNTVQHISMKYSIKKMYIWKFHLQNVDHFVQPSTCMPICPEPTPLYSSTISHDKANIYRELSKHELIDFRTKINIGILPPGQPIKCTSIFHYQCLTWIYTYWFSLNWVNTLTRSGLETICGTLHIYFFISHLWLLAFDLEKFLRVLSKM